MMLGAEDSVSAVSSLEQQQLLVEPNVWMKLRDVGWLVAVQSPSRPGSSYQLQCFVPVNKMWSEGSATRFLNIKLRGDRNTLNWGKQQHILQKKRVVFAGVLFQQIVGKLQLIQIASALWLLLCVFRGAQFLAKYTIDSQWWENYYHREAVKNLIYWELWMASLTVECMEHNQW